MYCVAKYTIEKGEITIPSLDFVVRGKGVAHNYDFLIPDPAYDLVMITVFDLGEEGKGQVMMFPWAAL